MIPDKNEVKIGHCLCGAIQYEVQGPLRAGTACHCAECRQASGGFWMATAAYEDRLEINDPDECLTWYASSDRARRGFCKRCGSSLFFDPLTAPYIAIGLGSMAAPTELALQRHIFIEEKGDFYEIADEVAQYESMPNILPMPDRD